MDNHASPKITLIYFDAGGGHRAAAQALQLVIASEKKPWDVELMNLQEVLDEIDPTRKYLKIRVQDIYNRILSQGWTLGAPTMLKGLHLVINAYRRKIVRQLQAHWNQARPQMVVSLIPNFNSCIAESINASSTGVPFVTILTDVADYPPHFWMERESQYIIGGSERACQQAAALGHGEGAVFRVSGMILNPRFYEPMNTDRQLARLDLDLDRDVPTALVLFGGYGSREMLTISERLEDCKAQLQAIFICGRNAKLQAKLRGRKLKYRFFVEGFTSEIPRYMAISDFMIGKPGPGSISEAVQMKLPVIVNCNNWTLPQERFNARWIEEAGVGLAVQNFDNIGAAAERLLENLETFKLRTHQLENRAVFEVVKALEHILQRHHVISGPAQRVDQSWAATRF